MNRASGTIAAAIAFAVFALASMSLQAAQDKPAAVARPPALLAVRKDLGAPPAGVTDLKFRDIFKMPVGDKGLEPSATLLALDGKRVRIVGYMVRQQPAPQGMFLLSPLPVEISDEDEPLADDLPPSVIAVEVGGAADKSIPLLSGLIQITGVLHIGVKTDAASGRVSSAQIALDARIGKALLGAQTSPATKFATRSDVP
jgi:hypothetical protein